MEIEIKKLWRKLVRKRKELYKEFRIKDQNLSSWFNYELNKLREDKS